MRLGRSDARVHVQAAVACGITSKGPWRSAKTPGINQALSLDYLKSEGLYSLRDGWIALHYPKCPPLRSRMQSVVGLELRDLRLPDSVLAS